MLDRYSHLGFESPNRGVWFATKDSVFQDLARALPSNKFKRRPLRSESKLEVEYRQAALFALARASVTEDPTLVFAMSDEQRDSVDCVLRTGAENYHYEPVQLKEVVPEDVNPKQTLEGLLEGICRKYGTGENLTVAIHINRNVSTILGTITQPNMQAISWWLFGLDAQNAGFLVRNPFAKFEVLRFRIPRPRSSMTQW